MGRLRIKTIIGDYVNSLASFKMSFISQSIKRSMLMISNSNVRIDQLSDSDVNPYHDVENASLETVDDAIKDLVHKTGESWLYNTLYERKERAGDEDRGIAFHAKAGRMHN
jgi:hypothetical protein